MQPRLRRWPWVAVVALAGLWPAGVWGAPSRPPIEVENVRVGFTTGTANNLFKVGSWTPVWVQLKAGEQRFTGTMELMVPDDNDTPTIVHQAIDLAAGESQRFTTYTRPGTIDPDFEIRLTDPERGVRTPRISGLNLAKKFDAIRADETLLLTLGKPQGVEIIPKLPGFANDESAAERGTVVGRLDAAGGYLPGRWYGYDAVRAVVLDTNDRAVMSSLDALRGRALVDWVRRGGHLVLAVGGNWQGVRDSVLSPILPAVPTGQQRINDLGGVESFASGSTKPISPGGEPVMVATLEEIEERGGKVLSRAAGAPVVVRGSHGFGRVTVIALDVDQKPFSTWDDRGLFWVRAIGLRRTGAAAGPNPAVSMGAARIYQTGVHDLSTKLRQALEQFEGVKLVSFGWVAFFIFLYILLIGPGDYLFLKKVVKRMELTWITFPLIVVTVSLLAYYAAYVVKGDVLRVNKVDVVDVLQGPGPENAVPGSSLVRGSTFLDVFSPQNRDYTASVVPLPLDRDAPDAGAGQGKDSAAPRPPAGTDVMLSWFGVPEPGFGGMGNRSQMTFSSGGYSYLPAGGAESLDGVRIPIWSTKCLTARWFGPGPANPLIESDLRPAGPDRLEGAVTNRSGVPLHDAVLAYNRQIYLLETIEPGATVRVALSQNRALSGHLRDKLQNYLNQDLSYARGNPGGSGRINRADLMLGLMFHEAAAAGTVENDAVGSNSLSDLDLTGLLQLDRPMLVARTDRTPSQLVLGNASSPPKVDQTTLLRVILPLQSGEKKP